MNICLSTDELQDFLAEVESYHSMRLKLVMDAAIQHEFSQLTPTERGSVLQQKLAASNFQPPKLLPNI